MEQRAAADMANRLMRELIPDDGGRRWIFKFDKAKRRFGVCDYGRRMIQLSLALTLLNDEDKVRTTVLHEIAHAIAGPGAGHGWTWKTKAVELGIRPDRCYSADDTVMPKGDWVGTCPKCGRTITKYRRPTSMKACGTCCRTYNRGRYDRAYVFEWTHQ